MGTISHDALIISTHGDAEAIRERILGIAREHWELGSDFEALVSPVIGPVVNGYTFIFVAPDGSKEWWGTSDAGDRFRQAVIDSLDSHQRVIQVRWGDLGLRISDGLDSVERRSS